MEFSEDLLVIVNEMARKREIEMEAAGKCLKIEWHDDTYTITKPNGGRIVGIGKDRAARFIKEYSNLDGFLKCKVSSPKSTVFTCEKVAGYKS